MAKKKIEEAAAAENERAFEDYHKSQEKAKEPEQKDETPVVTLSNPKWSIDRGYFNEKIKVSVEGVLPKESKKVTLVEFTLFAALPNGKLERIDAQDGLIRNSNAETDFILYWPQYRDDGGKLLEKCEYLFTAKHRYSESIISEKLLVTKREFCLQHIREVLETLEKEKGLDAARNFVSILNYNALCELVQKGSVDNDPNKMPTRYLILPGADDSKLETMDAHSEEKDHKVSVSNFRKGLNAIGFECAPDGPFDDVLRNSFDKYLQSFLPPPKNFEATNHKVEQDETLGKIASKYGVPAWKTLYGLNKDVIGNNPCQIKVGMNLRIPDRTTVRGEELIRQKGGDPKKLKGGTRYIYPWIHFSFSLTNEDHCPINFETDKKFTLELHGKEKIVHSGKISGNAPISVFVPYGLGFDLKVEGYDLGEQSV